MAKKAAKKGARGHAAACKRKWPRKPTAIEMLQQLAKAKRKNMFVYVKQCSQAAAAYGTKKAKENRRNQRKAAAAIWRNGRLSASNVAASENNPSASIASNGVNIQPRRLLMRLSIMAIGQPGGWLASFS